MPNSANSVLPQFAFTYCVVGFILATAVALVLSLSRAVPTAGARRTRMLGIGLIVEAALAGVLLAMGALVLNPAAAQEQVEKPLKDENAKLRQQNQQAAAATQQAQAQLQPLQQQAQLQQQALVKDEGEKQRLLQQTQNLGKEITTTVASTTQTELEQLRQQLQEAQAQIVQLKEVNGSLNDELGTHAVHRSMPRIEPAASSGMTPLTR